ncbi:MAG: hypothetical protein ACKOGM_01085 [Solirubrobacterales bacterium]
MSVRLNPIIAVGTALILALAVAAMAVPVEKAGAATLTACVNKKTGEMKMRFGKKAKKKCPKGYKKVTWNDSATSKLASVYAADGTRIGTFLGAGSIFAPWPLYQVKRTDGGQYLYSAGDGTMQSLGSPQFTDISCTGTGYLGLDSATPIPAAVVARYEKNLQGSTRIVFRTQNALGDLGVPRVWTGSGQSQAVGAPIPTYDLNFQTGACEVDDPTFTGSLLGLAAVTTPTPYDFVGPLEVR